MKLTTTIGPVEVHVNSGTQVYIGCPAIRASPTQFPSSPVYRTNMTTSLEQLGIGMTFDVNALKGHVRRLADEHPNNKYIKQMDAATPCLYGSGRCTNGSVGCIVGQAFKAMGVDPEALDRFLGEEPSGINDILDKAGLARDPWLESVQSHQDEGVSWGEAVERANFES